MEETKGIKLLFTFFRKVCNIETVPDLDNCLPGSGPQEDRLASLHQSADVEQEI